MKIEQTVSIYKHSENAIIIHIKQIKVIKTLHSIVLIETTELTGGTRKISMYIYEG